MKIAVCMKQVPAKDAPLRFSDDGTWVKESDISFETCEPDAFAIEAENAGRVMQSEDAREGPRAFAEKREPVYKGR